MNQRAQDFFGVLPKKLSIGSSIGRVPVCWRNPTRTFLDAIPLASRMDLIESVERAHFSIEVPIYVNFSTLNKLMKWKYILQEL